MSQFLKFEQEGPIGLLTIDRSEALNALNHELMTQLLQFFTLDAPRSGIQALVLTGAGGKAFIAGADIKSMINMRAEDMLIFSQLGQTLTKTIESLRALTFAAIEGFALGGGLEIALACDYIFASEKSKIGLPEVSLGLIPGFGGTQRLLRAVGIRKAKELILSGKIMTAQEGMEMGIVNRVCSSTTVVQACKDYARQLLENPHFALMQAKTALQIGNDLSLTEGLEIEKQLCALCFTRDERKERMEKFAKK